MNPAGARERLPDVPTGTVTLLFSDLEGSTHLLQQIGETYAGLLADVQTILRAAFAHWNGHEVDTQGDSFFVAFGRAGAAVQAAVEAQRALAGHSWPPGVAVRVRMGLHTGEPLLGPSGYTGLDVHRAARIGAAAHGGQVLLSQTTHDLLSDGDLPDSVSVRDLGEHRLKDLRRPRRLYQLTIAGWPFDFPPLQSLDPERHNLPIQLTSFIGRERELAAVKSLLATTHLLTLTGVGGTGKTRLALHVAADCVEQYGDGVWLVELAALSDPALVPSIVATTLGLRDQPGRPIRETLLDYLRGKAILLILDKCEHLIEACAQFADGILRACPRVRVLATSREGLGIAGEMIYPVPSLSLPGEAGQPESVAASESGRLFVERARAVAPQFETTAQNAGAIVQICRRLDGIPLALELAAARAMVLSPEQIAARLDDRFRLLTGGNRAALERHQTLRAAVTWSYGLLAAAERLLLERVAVFDGGWTLEAAEQVCSGDGIERDAVLDLLSGLVSKSLALMDAASGRSTRYRLLETIRQFAHEKLVESGDAERMRRCHLEFFVGLAAEAEPKLYGREQLAWLDRLEAELPNFRAADNWVVAVGDVTSSMRLAVDLAWFRWMRGHVAERQECLMRALATPGEIPPRLRARALAWAGDGANAYADFPLAKTLLDEGLAFCRALGDQYWTATTLWFLGSLALAQGDLKAARSCREEAHSLYEALHDRWAKAIGLLGLLNVAMAENDLVTVGSLGDQSLAIFRELGDEWQMAARYWSQGEVARYQGDYARARASFEEVSRLRHKLNGSRLAIAGDEGSLGYIALREGDYEEARIHFKTSLSLFHEQGIGAQGFCYTFAGLGGLAAVEGQPERAVQLLGASQAVLDASGSVRWLYDQADFDRDLAAARAQMDPTSFERAWAEGHALTLEQAIDLALGV